MLFALEWIRRALGEAERLFADFFGGLDFPSIAGFLTGAPLILIFAAAASVTLLLGGFRFHRTVSGLVGSAVCGSLGWFLGTLVNPELVIPSAVFMLLAAITGFFTLYVFCIVNVFLYGFIFAHAACAALLGSGRALSVVISAAFGLLGCALFKRFRLELTALGGSAALGVMLYPLSGAALACVAAAALAASGMAFQRAARRKYHARMEREQREHDKKYGHSGPPPYARRAAENASVNAELDSRPDAVRFTFKLR